MQRVVIDTNLFVSSLLNRRGAPAQVIDAWRQRKFILVISEGIIAEIHRVLSSSNIKQKYAISDQDIDEVLTLLTRETIYVTELEDVSGAIPNDPQDEIFLACALTGQADFILSGDKHLLGIQEYRGIPIITARQFLEKLD